MKNSIYRSLIITTAVSTSLLLCSCSLFKKQQPSMAQPDQLTVICENLKQDIILNDGINNMNDNSASPTKAASLYKQYDQYHCDDVIAGKRLVQTSSQPS